MMVSRDVLICNRRGLHARASAKFVTLATQQPLTVQVAKGASTVTGTSIMGLMMLAAAPGTTILVSAAGPEAQAALDAITALINDKFHEEGL